MRVPDPPERPGVYLFKDSAGKVIYVGKAKDLRRRVRSYFLRNVPSVRIAHLVEHIVDAEYFITSSEEESFLLESQLIKRHQPKYNVMLKSDVRHAYIRITDEAYPRLLEVRDTKGKGVHTGPYVDGYARRSLASALRKIFQIRTCKTMPERACLYYHIGLCSAPCIDKISAQDYRQNIQRALAVLRGKGQETIAAMQEEMKRSSESMEYEAAKQIRDKIRAIELVLPRQHVERITHRDEDVVAWHADNRFVQFIVMHIRKGVVLGKESFKLEALDGSLWPDFFARYYETHNIPDEIILAEKIDDLDGLGAYLTHLKGKTVRIIIPEKGERIGLVRIAQENAAFALMQKSAPAEIIALQSRLHLQSTPFLIDCVDISTLQGTATVASVVRFSQGKPEKSSYRHLHIKSFAGQDDFAAMKETLERYRAHLVRERRPFPDLIVIDGGPVQLRFAMEGWAHADGNVAFASLAKRFEEVYLPGKEKPIAMDARDSARRLLQRIRDEAHRFAVTFHRKTRTKKMLASALDDVPGLGPKKRMDLLKRFGSVDTIRSCSLEALSEVVGPALAKKIKERLS